MNSAGDQKTLLIVRARGGEGGRIGSLFPLSARFPHLDRDIRRERFAKRSADGAFRSDRAAKARGCAISPR